MLTTIPFDGFCNTWHDQLLDDALDQMLSDSSGCHVNEALHEQVYFDVKWADVHTKYAEAYAETWLELHGLKGRFVELWSPREYNFLTDRIYVDIDDADIERLFEEVPVKALDAKAREMFTSCSGFISFYSPDFSDWPELDEWDHNQVSCLVAAWSEWKDIMPEYESDLMDSYRDNGDFENWICSTENVVRVANIASYLRSREDRQYRWTQPGGRLSPPHEGEDHATEHPEEP
jgi:hypothetical protein